VGNVRGIDHLEDPGVDGDNIKMDLQEVILRDLDRNDVAQDRDRR
jgi:hypothetical protein